MRAFFRFLPIALLTLAAMPVAAQNAPFVLFCQGQCFAVDGKGVRTPAPKGTQLSPGQRLVTGPGSYAQLKLEHDIAIGLSEDASVRLQITIGDRDVVILDQGRIRVVGGEAMGRLESRTIVLQTNGTNLVLTGADVEVKASPPATTGGQALTYVKLNLGDARLGDLPITKDSVHAFTGGKVITDRIIPLSEIALPAPRRELPPGVTVPAPVAILPDIKLPATVLGPVRIETPTFYIPPPVVVAPVKSVDLVLTAPILTTSGELTSLYLIGTDLKTSDTLSTSTLSTTSSLSTTSLTTTGTLSSTTLCSTCTLTKTDLSTAIITAPSTTTFTYTRY